MQRLHSRGTSVGIAELLVGKVTREPVADRPRRPDRRCFADEDEEAGLEGVLGIVGVMQNAAANTQDRGTVPAQQSLEGGLVPLTNVQAQQVAIRHPCRVLPGEDTA